MSFLEDYEEKLKVVKYMLTLSITAFDENINKTDLSSGCSKGLWQ